MTESALEQEYFRVKSSSSGNCTGLSSVERLHNAFSDHLAYRDFFVLFFHCFHAGKGGNVSCGSSPTVLPFFPKYHMAQGMGMVGILSLSGETTWMNPTGSICHLVFVLSGEYLFVDKTPSRFLYTLLLMLLLLLRVSFSMALCFQ